MGCGMYWQSVEDLEKQKRSIKRKARAEKYIRADQQMQILGTLASDHQTADDEAQGASVDSLSVIEEGKEKPSAMFDLAHQARSIGQFPSQQDSPQDAIAFAKENFLSSKQRQRLRNVGRAELLRNFLDSPKMECKNMEALKSEWFLEGKEVKKKSCPTGMQRSPTSMWGGQE